MSTDVTPGQLGMATPYNELVGKSDAEMEAEFADYAALGVSWIRTDFYWGMIEPVKGGGYNWAKLDKIVDLADKYGIEVVALLSGKPSWTSAGFKTETDAAAYGNYAKALAEHFEGRVNYWEVMNEQNINGVAPADYVRMLKAAYTAIKAVDADSVVISGGLSPVPATVNGLYGAVDYLKAMYAAGAKDYFDAFGFHPYSWPLMPDDSKSWNGWQIMEDGIRQTMVANGDADLQVWITEMGGPTAGGTNAISEAQQLQILEQSVKLAYGYDWAGPILWYSYKDRGGATTDTENWFGLLGPNGEKKAAYYVFQQYATTDDDRAEAPVVVEPSFLSMAYFGDQTDNIVVGGDMDNIIKGAGGKDVLDGGKGHDLVDGGIGDDVLVGGEGNDILAGGGGNDSLTGGAGADIFAFGNDPGIDWILDYEKGDVIDLSAMDANTALAGLQTFTFVGSKWLSKPGDLGVYLDTKNNRTNIQMDVNGDGKHDLDIYIKGLHTLTAEDFRLTPLVETPTFVISANYTGTAGNDRLIGNAKANVISGMEGNDTIKGGAGDDVLVGHIGNDVLYGGAGADRFDFNDARYFGYDLIMDFEAGDRIDLSGVDANATLAGNQEFTLIGSKWLSKAGELGVYQDVNRNTTEIQGYVDNDKKIDFIIKLDGLHNLTAADLVL